MENKEIQKGIEIRANKITREIERAIIDFNILSQFSTDKETKYRCRLLINALLQTFKDKDTAEAIRLIREDRWDIELHKNDELWNESEKNNISE